MAVDESDGRVADMIWQLETVNLPVRHSMRPPAFYSPFWDTKVAGAYLGLDIDRDGSRADSS